MLKKLITLIMVGSIAICSLTSCRMPKSMDEIKTVIKDEVTDYPVKCGQQQIEQSPQRLIVLDDNIADILIACGYAGKIVGKSSECTQKEMQNVKEYGSNQKPDVANINKATADIVFVSSAIEDKVYQELKKGNKIVLKMSVADSLKDFELMYTNICKIMVGNLKGEDVGKEKSRKVLDDLNKAESNTVVKGCFLYGLDGKSAVTKDMYENEILSLAGVQNIAGDSDLHGNLDMAKIVSADKQEGFAFYLFCESGMGTKILSDKTLKTTNAVIKSRVIEVPKEYLTRQGVTAVKGVQYLISAIRSQNDTTSGADISADYGITLYDGMLYTIGAEDSYVLAIQKRLDDLGYLSINQTGYFGESTAEALKLFQSNNETSRRDGVADKDTLDKLFSTSAFANSRKITKNTLPQSPTESATFYSVNAT